MKQQYTEQQAWDATRTMDHAAEYLMEDAGQRDIQWTEELHQACDIFYSARKHSAKLAMKLGAR